MSSFVPVHELRVGMFIHLDLGWMDHPFPLSNFRIASVEQIETLRGLGLKTLRWSPEKSDPAEAESPAAAADEAPAAVAETAGQAAARQRREALLAQRAATQLCERQHAEAGRAWRAALDRVQPEPEVACRQTQALTRTLLDKMLSDGESCIRLIASQAGDRSTAHALNVGIVAMLLGRSMGVGESGLMDLGVGALMHDVGKLDLPDRLRHLDEAFNAAETNAYREHVGAGVAHGRRMGLSSAALLVLAQHHECADGSGFPQKTSADRQTLAARIVALVNRYDNLCNPAVLARALTPHEALSLLFAQNRSKFDAAVLNAFIRMMGVYPAGSVVQLTDDRYALVVGVNAARPLKPRVLVHDPRIARDEALLVNLETVVELGIRRSLNPSRLPPMALEYLAPRPRVSYFFEQLQSGAPVGEGVAAHRPDAACETCA